MALPNGLPLCYLATYPFRWLPMRTIHYLHVCQVRYLHVLQWRYLSTYTLNASLRVLSIQNIFDGCSNVRMSLWLMTVNLSEGLATQPYLS